MYSLQMFGFVFRRLNHSYAQNGHRLASRCRQCDDPPRFGTYRKKFSVWLKKQSEDVAKACTRQFEFIIAQRVRRSIQIFHLYTRIWDEVALREFLRSWRKNLQKNTKHFLLGAVGVAYNWDSDRITDEELNSYKDEIKGIHRLMGSTVICTNCNLRIVIDVCQPGVKYCQCNGHCSKSTSNQDPEEWQPFIEREDMLIWRKEEPNSGGQFAYKVYGNFADVTADDFLQVQIDVDYRREWDTTAQDLHILETDPTTHKSMDESTDVIYWEMIWPRLFANRDYVYQRRWIVDRDQRLIVIISRVTEHPRAPTRPGVYRVTSYWSYMVIRPYTDFHKPGIEFGLTYFDDPGVNIPSAVRAWVAMTGVPDFLIRMRQASKNYKQYKMSKGDTLREPDPIDFKGDMPDTDEEEDEQRVQNVGRISRVNMTKYEMEKVQSVNTTKDSASEVSEKPRIQSNIETVENNDSSPTDKDKGFLQYFFITKLFP